MKTLTKLIAIFILTFLLTGCEKDPNIGCYQCIVKAYTYVPYIYDNGLYKVYTYVPNEYINDIDSFRICNVTEEDINKLEITVIKVDSLLHITDCNIIIE